MNQTNFGYNPARNTLVQNQPYDATSFDSISGQRQLNTQRRNRTSTIEGTGAVNNQIRGNSLNVQDLQYAYN